MSSANTKKIGLIACTGLVAGNMMGSGIALLPSSLASYGSITIYSWAISLVGALALAYVYARMATVNPQSGGPVAYAGEVSPIFGFQTGVLYYHANWIGNLAIAITAVSYLSTFFPILNEHIPAAIASIAIVWFFTFVNLLGGGFVSRLTTIGVVLVLIPVVGTALFGWFWFDSATYATSWNVSAKSDSTAITQAVILCLWSFIGVESASVSTGLVDNPKRTVPMATMLGTALAGIIYIAATQAISGMFPASELAKSGAPFGMAASLMVGSWANSVVSLFTALACLTSLGSWMMLVGQAGARAASDGNFPAVYGEMSASGIPRKGLILASIKMTVLMIMVAFLGSQGGSAASLFTQITSIAVLLTMLPYFYSCINLIRMEGANAKNMLSMLAGILGSAFCFVALAGAEQAPLAGTFIVSLIILIFYTRKIAKRGAAGQTQS